MANAISFTRSGVQCVCEAQTGASFLAALRVQRPLIIISHCKIKGRIASQEQDEKIVENEGLRLLLVCLHQSLSHQVIFLSPQEPKECVSKDWSVRRKIVS